MHQTGFAARWGITFVREAPPNTNFLPLPKFTISLLLLPYAQRRHHRPKTLTTPVIMTASLTPSKYVTLVSGDGFEFVVLRDAAMISPIIKGMLDPTSA